VSRGDRDEEKREKRGEGVGRKEEGPLMLEAWVPSGSDP
jgi:hypothetical protein